MSLVSREFYNRETTEVAKALLGMSLVHRFQEVERIGKIVEVEAYLGQHDLACHASKGRTKRTELMFGPPGHAYVYLIYGMYHCFNIVTEDPGIGSAVLVRAVEPVANIKDRSNGPGLLCKAMGLDKGLNGQDLISDVLYVTDTGYCPPHSVIEAPRIGVAYAGAWAEKPLRYYIEGNAWVSKDRSNKTHKMR